MGNIRVGTATVDFTPEPGLPLLGNFRDDYAARGVHDPLRAKAMVVADERGTKAAVLSVDLCLLDRENVARMRRQIGSECDVPAENVLIHATHTHSGPATNNWSGLAEHVRLHQAAIDGVLAKAASAVAAADANLAEATLAVGHAREDRVSFNRRLQRKDGSTQVNWEALVNGFDPAEIVGPWGPIDPAVACLVIERAGRPTATMVNFGLHPAILAGDNWLYSADYPGYLAEALGRTLGEDLTTLFLNGCCGDVNHVDYREPLQGRGYQMTQRVGYMLAAAALQAINARVPAKADRVVVSREKVALERIKISEAECLRCEQVLRQARDNPPKSQVDGVPDTYFADVRLRMHENQHEPDRAEVMVIRLGDVALVGMPGEPFCELGMEIKRRSPASHTLVAGLCGEAIGYLPTRESFAQGGYETTIGCTYHEPGAGEQLADAAVEQLHRLFEQ